jgi:hypothetical protein
MLLHADDGRRAAALVRNPRRCALMVVNLQTFRYGTRYGTGVKKTHHVGGLPLHSVDGGRCVSVRFHELSQSPNELRWFLERPDHNGGLVAKDLTDAASKIHQAGSVPDAMA